MLKGHLKSSGGLLTLYAIVTRSQIGNAVWFCEAVSSQNATLPVLDVHCDEYHLVLQMYFFHQKQTALDVGKPSWCVKGHLKPFR